MTLQTEPGTAKQSPKDPEDIIHDWLLAIMNDHRPKEIADILGTTNSKVWKLRKGHQRLQATELLILHEVLDMPLPTLGYRNADQAEPAKRVTKEAGSTEETSRLFKNAYALVNQREMAKPEDQRLDKFQKLEQVFHILTLIEQTPEALELSQRHE